MSEQTRAWIYRVLVGAAPLAIAYGAVSESTAPLWLALGANVLGFGLASANTSTHPD